MIDLKSLKTAVYSIAMNMKNRIFFQGETTMIVGNEIFTNDKSFSIASFFNSL